MNGLALSLFADLAHARQVAVVPDAIRGGVCEDPARRAILVFAAVSLKTPRFAFEAVGGPLLLAGAEWLCRDAELSGGWPAWVNMEILAEELDVSPAGRSELLLIEDAAISLAGHLALG